VRKRLFDLAVATLGLVLLAPLLLALALLVKIDSPGPAFYRGQRVGKDGRVFRIWKLRTMVADAESLGPPLTMEDDPRITRMGRVLRSTRLDEVPLLINVLRGEMSLVGPTPEHPILVGWYTAEQRQVLSLRPGMTSPAALAFCDEERILAAARPSAYLETVLPVKLDLDLAYVRQHSFASDLVILARTLALACPKQLVRLRRLSTLGQHRPLWALIDAVVVVISFGAAFALRWIDAPSALRIPELPLVGSFVVLTALYVAWNYLVGLHRVLWRYATVTDMGPILAATLGATATAVALTVGLGASGRSPLPIGVLLLGGFFSFCGFAGVRYGGRYLTRARQWKLSLGARRTRTLIYGAGEAGQLLAWRLRTRDEGRSYRLIGFIDDSRSKRGLRIHGIEVLGNRSDLAHSVERERVELIVLAISNITGEKRRAIISAAQQTPAQIKIAPGAFAWMAPGTGVPLVREIRVEDLLGRPPAALDRAACQRTLGDKIVMVTGACGSIGSELCRQIAGFGPQRLVIVDNNETGVYDLELELRARLPTVVLAVVVADVTNQARLQALFRTARPQVIFHVAAYKHVPLMQEYPEEAVRVNIGGTWNTLQQARRFGAERFVLVSTDKAVNPSSVMGATKRVAEMLVMSDDGPGGEGRAGEQLYTAVRFGNVLGSRGSVVPTFARQIELGGPVTVTHPEMTRYFMDVSEAAGLIIQAAALTRGRDIFMLDMGEHIRIDDLARKMIRMRGLRPEVDIPIVYTGMRPGEKLHEELTYDQEEKLPTSHPLITRLRGNGTTLDSAELRPAVQRLLDRAARGTRDELVAALLALSQRGLEPARARATTSPDQRR